MKQNLVGKILGKIKIFVQDFVTIVTGIMGTKSCTKSPKDFQMAGNVLSWQNLSPRFSNGGCHENLDAARKSIAPLLFLGDKQKTLQTQKRTRCIEASV